jgi:hypothetical protein
MSHWLVGGSLGGLSRELSFWLWMVGADRLCVLWPLRAQKLNLKDISGRYLEALKHLENLHTLQSYTNSHRAVWQLLRARKIQSKTHLSTPIKALESTLNLECTCQVYMPNLIDLNSLQTQAAYQKYRKSTVKPNARKLYFYAVCQHCLLVCVRVFDEFWQF